MRRKLHEITSSVRDIFRKNVDPETGEISDDAYNQLDDLDLEAADKIHACAQKLRHMTNEIENAKEEVLAINTLIKSMEKERTRLEMYVAHHMRELSIVEVIREGRKITVKNLDDSVVVTDKHEFIQDPDYEKLITITPVKRPSITKIKQFLEDNPKKLPRGVGIIRNRFSLKY